MIKLIDLLNEVKLIPNVSVANVLGIWNNIWIKGNDDAVREILDLKTDILKKYKDTNTKFGLGIENILKGLDRNELLIFNQKLLKIKKEYNIK
jgi:hypothetical protein